MSSVTLCTHQSNVNLPILSLRAFVFTFLGSDLVAHRSYSTSPSEDPVRLRLTLYFRSDLHNWPSTLAHLGYQRRSVQRPPRGNGRLRDFSLYASGFLRFSGAIGPRFHQIPNPRSKTWIFSRTFTDGAQSCATQRGRCFRIKERPSFFPRTPP